MPLYLAGLAPREQRRRATAVLERVGLGDRVQPQAERSCSVGQQQRVALARTLANDPALILADEPTGNLDPQTREQVLALFDEFHAEGRTIVMVTHDPHGGGPAPAARLRLEDGAVSTDGPRRHVRLKVA